MASDAAADDTTSQEPIDLEVNDIEEVEGDVSETLGGRTVETLSPHMRMSRLSPTNISMMTHRIHGSKAKTRMWRPMRTTKRTVQMDR
jgi:hypothetical protein